jgi:lipid-A-disaccharide synthase
MQRKRSVTTILVSAGDASGEAHAAELVRAMRERRPDLRFVGMGGPRMAAAGVEIVVDQSELAVGGFFEILPSLGRLWSAWRRMLTCARSARPAAIVLVDSGGFHLPFARQVRRRVAAPILYFVAPQAWAWRPHRARKIAARADRIAVILPFEAAFYAKRGIEVDFVGHPLLDRVASAPDGSAAAAGRAAAAPLSSPGHVGAERERARARLGIAPYVPVLAIFPGSRRNELARNLPVQLEAFARLREAQPGLQGIVGLAESLDLASAKAIVGRGPRELGGALRIVRGESETLGWAADVALAKPGTITVELMLRGCPMVVMGRVHPWSARLARLWVDLPWLAMPNLIAGETIVPELMQEAARPDRIVAALAPLFEEPARQRQIEALARASQRLGAPGAVDRTAAILEEMLDTAGA